MKRLIIGIVDQDITKKKVQNTLTKIKTGKTAGLDGKAT